MVKTLLAILGLVVSSTTLELAGAAAIAVGVYLAFGWPAALITVGVVLVLKAAELEASR